MKKIFLFFLPFFLTITDLSAASSDDWNGYIPVFLPSEIDAVTVVKSLKEQGIIDVVFSQSPLFPPEDEPIYNHNFSQGISSETFSLLFFDDSGKNNVFYISEKEFKSKKVTDVLKNFDASWSVPENEGGGKAYLLFWIILISMWALFSRNLFFIIASLPFFVAGMFITRLGFFHAAILFLQSVCIFSKYKKGHKPFQMVKKDKSIPLFLIISIPVAVFDSITAFFL